MYLRLQHHLLRKLSKKRKARVVEWLYHRRSGGMTVDPQGFEGRHVVVLGPAESAEADLTELQSRNFDVVIKFNNGLDTPFPALGDDALRCDVLFHSLTKAARTVSPQALRRAGVRVLVHRTPAIPLFEQTLHAELFLGRKAGVDVRVIPVADYARLSQDLGGRSPSSGLVALDLLLSLPVASLTVVGFTFFATRYISGYDDRFTTDSEALQRVVERGHHDPSAEARFLKSQFESALASGMDLRLGASVRQALDTEFCEDHDVTPAASTSLAM